MKITKEAKELAKQIAKQGFTTKVYVDSDGRPVFVYVWANDIVVSKLGATSS
jgi:thioredoxin-like negative regulator of GroEL